MQYARLGNTGLLVSRLSLGAMTFMNDESVRSQTVKMGREDADRMVGRALDAGINFFDNADIYGGGGSEVMLGAALASRRAEAVIATKVGYRSGAALTQAGLSRRHILWSIDSSLGRLGTDYVDVYIAHRVDPLTPLEETLEALDCVVRSGKARYIGFSNWPAWKVAAALELQKQNGWAQFTHGQMLYSLVARDLEVDLLPMLQHYGLGLTAYSPLAAGFLSGRYGSDRKTTKDGRLAIFDIIQFDRDMGMVMLEHLRGLAEQRGVSVAQISLAWLLTKKHVTSIILGASRIEQFESNLGALDVPLDAAELAELDRIGTPPLPYPHWGAAMFRDKQIAEALG
jgi:aryl-alcohol dehydrogenase-like predicted oxidoreductase